VVALVVVVAVVEVGAGSVVAAGRWPAVKVEAGAAVAGAGSVVDAGRWLCRGGGGRGRSPGGGRGRGRFGVGRWLAVEVIRFRRGHISFPEK
jgi:hypothetical protein